MSIALPGTPDYAAAVDVFNLSAPARPAAAATVRTVDEVRAALSYAQSRSLPVRVHTTGHAAAAVRPVTGGLLLRTQLAGAVEVDSVRRVARIPAGTRWGEVVAATSPHGLVAAHGSSGTVGVVGYVLRGGLSCYGRYFGLAANSIRAVELVTADGALHRLDADHDPELFWAVRGGGGGFGVVTAVEVALRPARWVVTGSTFWRVDDPKRLLGDWISWTRQAPPEVTTSIRLLNLPSTPETPSILTGATVVCLEGTILCPGDADLPAARTYAEQLLDPLRSVAEPVLDAWRVCAPESVLEAQLDPADPLPFTGDHMLLGELDAAAVEAFVRAAGPGSGSPLVIAGLRQLGGGYAQPDPAGGVLSHLPASFSYAGSGSPVAGPSLTAIRQHCEVVRQALSPWDTGMTAPSFVESFQQPQRHLSDQQRQAVERIRRRVDPGGRFSGDVSP